MTRAKDNLRYRAVKNLSKGREGIFKDQIISLSGRKGMRGRRVEARVEVDGEERVMVFITNNLAWSARSVCDLYRRRWDIEVFFKQVKGSLKLTQFLGHSANAVRCQVYTALLIYVLLRFQAWMANWGHSFARLFAVVRSTLWERFDLAALLRDYGTAAACFKVLGSLQDAWLPGLEPAGT
ncbi:MAG TPA: transposase [Chthoniobacterales bacterium]